MFEMARKMRARHAAMAKGERGERGGLMMELLGYLVVFAIIIGGIIVGVGIYRQNAADNNARSDVSRAVTEIESYRTTHDDALPDSMDDFVMSNSAVAGSLDYNDLGAGNFCVSASWDTERYGAADDEDGLFHYDSSDGVGVVERGGC